MNTFQKFEGSCTVGELNEKEDQQHIVPIWAANISLDTLESYQRLVLTRKKEKEVKSVKMAEFVCRSAAFEVRGTFLWQVPPNNPFAQEDQGTTVLLDVHQYDVFVELVDLGTIARLSRPIQYDVHGNVITIREVDFRRVVRLVVDQENIGQATAVVERCLPSPPTPPLASPMLVASPERTSADGSSGNSD